MLTVAQWRTARHMQNGAANDLLEKDQEKMQLNFGVGDSLRGCLGGSEGCCCETSHAASLTFCPSSCKIFSVGNFWHFPICLLNSGSRRTGMKNQTQMLSPSQGLWVLVSPLKHIFTPCYHYLLSHRGTNSTQVPDVGLRPLCCRHCTSKELQIVSIFNSQFKYQKAYSNL